MKIRLEIKKLQYDINREATKYQLYHQAKLISINILLVKKYYLVINNKELNKLNLLILLWENLANTQKLTIKNIIPEDVLNDEAKKEMDKIMEIEKTVIREILIYRASEYIYTIVNFFKQANPLAGIFIIVKLL